MSQSIFKISVGLVGLIFSIYFSVTVIPSLINDPDIIGAFASGFVNPYASGYSFDVICCALILWVWILYEVPRVKYGWICALLCLVPGVAVGFAAYLILRMNQPKNIENE